MVEYNKVNVKLSDSLLNRLKTAIKNQTGATLRMNIKMFNRNNLHHELLLITRQTTKLRNAIENNMSTGIKLSRAQISKLIQSGGFLGSLLSKLAGPLMKVAAPLSKNILAPLGITAAASAIDAGIQKKIHGSGTTTLIISNEEMNDLSKILQALEDFNILLKGITKTIENETKGQKEGFLGMLLGTLGASLLGNMLTGKAMLIAGYENKEEKGVVRTRDNLPKAIKDWVYVINPDEHADVGTHWIALYVKTLKLFTLTVLELNMSLKKLKSLLGIKT